MAYILEDDLSKKITIVKVEASKWKHFWSILESVIDFALCRVDEHRSHFLRLSTCLNFVLKEIVIMVWTNENISRTENLFTYFLRQNSYSMCQNYRYTLWRYLDNYRNFQPTEVFSSRMCSHGNKDNFQVTEKISRLMKKWCFLLLFYVIVLSILRGSRISNSWISCFNWRGTLSTDDGICTTLKTSDLYVTFQSSFTFFCFRFRGKSSTGHHWVGIRGVLIKINWMIYTYLNSAKHEDSGYTSH